MNDINISNTRSAMSVQSQLGCFAYSIKNVNNLITTKYLTQFSILTAIFTRVKSNGLHLVDEGRGTCFEWSNNLTLWISLTWNKFSHQNCKMNLRIQRDKRGKRNIRIYYLYFCWLIILEYRRTCISCVNKCHCTK